MRMTKRCARGGTLSSARLVIESINRQDCVDAVIERQDERAAPTQILRSARALERAGADFIVVSRNDVHRFIPEMEPQLGIPFLHIAEATADAIDRRGLRRVALLGVRKTMERDFYPEIFQQHRIETAIPDDAQRAFVHDRIYNELAQGVFTADTRLATKRS